MKSKQKKVKNRELEKGLNVELDSETIPYFVKLSLKNGVDYKVLIKNALAFIIEKNMEPRNVWKKKRNNL